MYSIHDKQRATVVWWLILQRKIGKDFSARLKSSSTIRRAGKYRRLIQTVRTRVFFSGTLGRELSPNFGNFPDNFGSGLIGDLFKA